MEAAGGIRTAPAPARAAGERSPRLLSLASDERLVKRTRAGSDAAFEALYERYHRNLLSFCRHMLGSQAEAEDAVQQSFVNAYRAIVGGEQDLRVRPWLYRIARNQCISMLRARRPDAELPDDEPSAVGLADEVAGRSDLRELLRDLGRLPADQREALLLAELHDNSHADVAVVLGCEVQKVKALVFQARSSLVKSRHARELPCAAVQEQLSALRGGALRRTELRRHMADCPACRSFYEEVKRQRAALALVLPAAPSAALKLGAPGVLAAAKAAGAGAATSAGAVSAGAGAGGAAAAAGPLGALAAKLGASSTALKATAAALALTAAAGGTAGVEVARHGDESGGRGHGAAPLVQHRPGSQPASQPTAATTEHEATRSRAVDAGRHERSARHGHGASRPGRRPAQAGGSTARDGGPGGRPIVHGNRPARRSGGDGRPQRQPRQSDPRRGHFSPGSGASGRGSPGGGRRLEGPRSGSGGDSREGGSGTQPSGPLG